MYLGGLRSNLIGEYTVEKIGDGVNYLPNVWRKVEILT